MSPTLSMLWLERRHPLWAIAWLLFGGLGLAISLYFLTDRLLVWGDVWTALYNALWLLGPALSGLAMLVAPRERRLHLHELVATTARPRSWRHLVEWVALFVFAILLFATVLSGVTLYASRVMGRDHPSLLIALDYLAGLTLYLTLGYSAGLVMARRAALPALVVGLLLLNTLVIAVANRPASPLVGLLHLLPYAPANFGT